VENPLKPQQIITIIKKNNKREMKRQERSNKLLHEKEGI